MIDAIEIIYLIGVLMFAVATFRVPWRKTEEWSFALDLLKTIFIMAWPISLVGGILIERRSRTKA